jgi:hypothetical protein
LFLGLVVNSSYSRYLGVHFISLALTAIASATAALDMESEVLRYPRGKEAEEADNYIKEIRKRKDVDGPLGDRSDNVKDLNKSLRM